MDGKDVIKLILCLYGYDTKMKVEQDENGIYTAYAENPEIGDVIGNRADTLPMMIYDILENMCVLDRKMDYDGWRLYPLSFIIDDEKRQKTIDHRNEVESMEKRFAEFKNSTEVRDLFIEKDSKEHPEFYQKQIEQ